MQIYFNFNLSNIKLFVEQTAKYQKVMLVYDDHASNQQIKNIYDEVKPLCVFNQCHYKDVLNEIYNGYKTIIFMCGANSLLSLNLNYDEFNCIFLPTDNFITCFLTHNSSKNAVLLAENSFDISLVTSVLFNTMYMYLNELSAGQNISFNLPELNSVTLNGTLQFFLNANLKDFIDLQIAKNCNIEYEYLPIIDYILIDGLNLLFNNFLNKDYQYVDFYKSVKENAPLIDKFYALIFNNTLKLTMEYNHTNIKDMFAKINYVLNKINYCFIKPNQQKLTEIFKKLKNYTKNCTNLLANLYLFNFFGV